MPSSGMLCREALVRTDVSGEYNNSIIRVTRIGELGTTLALTSKRRRCENCYVSVHRLLVTAIFVTLKKMALHSSETSVLTRDTRRTIPEDGVLHSHGREHLKSYLVVMVAND
jgi:hypothetical protein